MDVEAIMTGQDRGYNVRESVEDADIGARVIQTGLYSGGIIQGPPSASSSSFRIDCSWRVSKSGVQELHADLDMPCPRSMALSHTAQAFSSFSPDKARLCLAFLSLSLHHAHLGGPS